MYFFGFICFYCKKKRSNVTDVQRILTAFVHAFVHGSELKNSEYSEMR